MKYKILPWIYVILWCTVIFLFSSIPHLKIEALGFWDLVFRKIAHITEYFILVILFLRAFSKTTRLNKFSIYFWSIFLSIIYAVTDEFHQHFVPGRHFAITDIMIDTFGVLLGSIFYHRYKWDKFSIWLLNTNRCIQD